MLAVPNVSDRSPTVAESVRDSIVVNADPDTIMDFIADFERYPSWQEDIRDVEVLEHDENGWGTRVRFDVTSGPLAARLVLAYTYDDNAMRWELVESDKIRVNTGAYLLEDLGDGTTKVTYELEAEPKIPVPRMVRRQIARKLIDAALSGVKRTVEASA
jgi:uncharacterized membrane protein